MAIERINNGSYANDPTADNLYEAFNTINDNYDVIDENQETFETSVQDQIDDFTSGEFGNIDWDFEATFNDSLAIQRGYGTYDQIDVSAAQDESIMVDLPTKSVDFSRASSTGNINKSSSYEEVGVDEPAIGSDGVGVFGSYTNKLLYSDDLTESDWNTTRATVTEDSDGSYVLEVSDASGYSRVRQLATTTTYGIFKARMKAGTSSIATIRIEGDVNTSLYCDLTDSFQDFYLTITGAVSNVSIFPHSNATAGSGNIGDNIVIERTLLVDSLSDLPYIDTDSTTVTRSADIATIPMENNFPASGESFTIVTDLLVGGSGTRIICRNGTSLTLYLNSSNQLYFGVYDNDSSSFTGTLTASGLSSGDYVRIVAKFDGTYCYAYVNGGLIGTSSALVDPNMASSGNLSVGSNNGSAPIGSYIKNFRIIHRALSGGEITALGGPK